MKAKFSKDEIREVIRRVLTYYLRRREFQSERRKRLFLIPRFPAGLQELLAELELYGELETVDFFLEERAEAVDITGCRMFYLFDAGDVSYILNGLPAYERLELYDPSLEFLRAVREGKERELAVKITLYFLLSKKPVMARLPYELASVSGGVFGRMTKELKEDLGDMGMIFLDLKPETGELFPSGTEGSLTLVTEEAVRQAHERGERLIFAAEGAVITPLAAEKAKECGISIRK